MHKVEPMRQIPIAGPWITQREIDYVTDAVTNAWYSKANIYHERFEKAFADYLGVRYAVALSSCTSAIHLSLLALNIKKGDEVVVPEITWIASAAPITYVGATPVFADINEKTWCLSARSFEKLLTRKTKAVIPVNLYGNTVDMDAINEIAGRHNIAVIEDAAQAIGSEYKGRKAGNFGTTSTFSFHGSKTVTTGEGGMLVTDREDIYKRVLFLMDHGRQPGNIMFYNTEVAWKYKMSSMQAALGLAQIERVNELIERKRLIFKWYKDRLGSIDGLTLNYEAPDTKNTYWMIMVIVDKKFKLKKEELIKIMLEKNIGCRPFFYPLSSLPAYKDAVGADDAKQRNSVSYKLSPWGISLPSNLAITEEEVDYVCECLKSAVSPLVQRRRSA